MSGGGARGLTYIGIIEELERQGYTITSIAGTSIGALIGGVYAAGKLKEFKKWVLSLSKYDVYKLIDFTLNLGFIKLDNFFNELSKIIGCLKFSDLNIDLNIIATNLNTKEEVIFNEGSLFDAIRASISYPTIITPHYIDKIMYVDGGIVNPIPINRVKRIANDILIAVDLSSEIPYKKEPIINIEYSLLKKIYKSWRGSVKKKTQWTYLKLIDQSLSIMTKQLTLISIKMYKVDYLIKISSECGGFFDYYNAKELIKYGKSQTKLYMKN